MPGVDIKLGADKKVGATHQPEADRRAVSDPPLKVAVVTPYFETNPQWIRECHDSVLSQNYPCTHLLVGDGASDEAIDDWSAIHLKLPRNLGDYGDTPRALGSIYAAGLGFDAIAYLDADNWYLPWHIQSLVKLHQSSGAAVCTSGRVLHALDGACLGVDPDVDGENFVDTSCMLFTREAFDVFPVWAAMSPQFHAIDDRVVWAEVLDRRLTRAHSALPSAAYRTGFQFHYERFGQTPPDEAKTGGDVLEMMRLVSEDEERQSAASQKARQERRRGPGRPGRVWRYRVQLPRAEEKLASPLGILPGGGGRPRRTELPDFLCIGAQKAGTTWLYRNLEAHAGIFFPSASPDEPDFYAKEAHFFNLDERYEQGIEFYTKRFRKAEGRLKGDMTPNYASLPLERIRAVHELMPDVRLMYLLRDPVERAWSRLLMVIDQDPARELADMSSEEIRQELVKEDIQFNSDYLTVIGNWLRYFSGEQLWIGFLDDIRTQPEALIREVLTHIGADVDVDLSQFPLSKRYYEGTGIPIPPDQEVFLRGLYHERIEKLFDRFGERVASWRTVAPSE
jgi:hypothetical protein